MKVFWDTDARRITLDVQDGMSGARYSKLPIDLFFMTGTVENGSFPYQLPDDTVINAVLKPAGQYNSNTALAVITSFTEGGDASIPYKADLELNTINANALFQQRSNPSEIECTIVFLYQPGGEGEWVISPPVDFLFENAIATGYEGAPVPLPNGIAWGDITGDIDLQTDLMALFNGKISSVVAGTGVSVDNADPQNPIVSAVGLGGTVTQVDTGAGLEGGPITTTGTVRLNASSIASLGLADSAVQNLVDLGITATATEINFIDGVTSAIQTQLDGKLSNITGLVAAGTNVTIGGSGASGDPYVINASGGGGGSGDVVGPASSVDGQVALFDGITGKLLEAATSTGVAKLSSGVLSASNVDLSLEVTGLLPLANLEEITGLTVLGRSSSMFGPIAPIGASVDGYVLRRSGSSLDFGTLASGAFASNTVPKSAIANGTALSLLGRSANSTGALADIVAASDGQVMRRSGTSIGFGAIDLSSSNAVSGLLADANISSASTWNAKIGGSTGATDNAVLLANGTGGVTAKSSNNSLVMNVASDLLRVGDDTSGSWLHLGEFTANSGYAAIYFNQSSPSGTNYGFLGDAFGTYLNAVTLVRLGINNAGTLYVDPSGIYGDNNVLNIASGGASQTLRVARTYSSSTNHEAISLFFDSSVGKIGTVVGSGGGTVRDWDLIRGSTAHATIGSSGVTVNTLLSLQKTITPGGTTGAQSISTQSGSVNFAAAAMSLVVTSSIVTTSSLILCSVMTNDGSMSSAKAVAGSGSFTIYPDSPPGAETKVAFLIIP